MNAYSLHNQSCNGSSSRLKAQEKMNVRTKEIRSSDDSLSYEFDLHQLYHNAIECLINCDQTIKSLQKDLLNKDSLIASLESQIIDMSLELASSKALVDKLRVEVMIISRRPIITQQKV